MLLRRLWALKTIYRQNSWWRNDVSVEDEPPHDVVVCRRSPRLFIYLLPASLTHSEHYITLSTMATNRQRLLMELLDMEEDLLVTYFMRREQRQKRRWSVRRASPRKKMRAQASTPPPQHTHTHTHTHTHAHTHTHTHTHLQPTLI